MLDVALGMVGIWYVPGEFVEFRRTDGAHRASKASRVARRRRAASMRTVAGGCLEGRQSGLQSNMKEREGGQTQ